VEEDHYEIGDKVFLHGLKKWGLVRFCGKTLFSDGLWLGVELSEPCGKNDGAVQRTRYFRCPHMCGVFVRPMNCSTSEASTSRPNTPEMRRRLSTRSPGLMMTPTRIMPRRGLQPASTGKLKGQPGKAEDGEWEQFRPRSHSHYDLETVGNGRDELGGHTNDITATNTTNYRSVRDQYEENGESPYSPRKDRRVNLINRMNEAIQSQSLDQTDKESQPSPPVTPAFTHFSPGRERIHDNDPVKSNPQRNMLNTQSSSLVAVRDSVGGLGGEAPSKSGSGGDDNARLNSLESKMATLLTAYQTQREATESVEKQLGGRVSQLEETLDGFGSTLGGISSTLESILTARNEANESNSGDVTDKAALEKEVEQLKSALAMVSGLAKQAHKATIKERQQHVEKIQNLQNQLDAYENAKPIDSNE